MALKSRKKKVVVCGEKLVAERCLEYLEKRDDTEICGIVAAAEDWQADLISWGVKRRVRVFAGNINDYLAELSQMDLDFIFSIQYRPLLKREVLKLPKEGCINLHFGLLPRYGGCYPIAWAILNGEREAGATLHYMVENFDEGDIISQVKMPINTDTTARKLFDSVSDASSRLFGETYPAICNDKIEPLPQDLTRRLYYSKESIDFKKGSLIDWKKTGIEIQRRICAFTFQPFQLPETVLRLPNGSRLNVNLSCTRLCRVPGGDLQESIGYVKEVTGSGGLMVVTGDGSLIAVEELNGQTALGFVRSLGVQPEEIVFD